MTSNKSAPIKEFEVFNSASIWILKLFGVWDIINFFRINSKVKRGWQCLFIASYVAVLPYLVSQFVGAFYVSLGVVELSLYFLNPLTAIQTLLKMSIFYFRIEEQSRLFDLLKKNFLLSIPFDKVSSAEEILRKVNTKSNYLSIVALFVNINCVLVWNFLPFLRSEIVAEYLHFTPNPKNTTIPNKILAAWYPFDFRNSPGYEVAFIYEFILVCIGGLVVTFHELMVMQTVMMLYGQMSVLAYNLEMLKQPEILNDNIIYLNSEGTKEIAIKYPQNPGTMVFGPKELIEVKIEERLLLCIKDHQRLMQAADDVKSLYNFVITGQLLTGGLIMILSAFNFVFGLGDELNFIKFSIFFAYAMVETTLYCYSGCLLETASEEMTLAAYCSDWYKCSTKFRKYLQMVMVRNTRPQTLIAGRLYPVNLITLSNLMQLIYSTTTLLSRLNEM